MDAKGSGAEAKAYKSFPGEGKADSNGAGGDWYLDEEKPMVSRGSHGEISRLADEKIDREMRELNLAKDDEMGVMSTSEKARQVGAGLRIVSMNMRDGDSNTLLWESEAFKDNPDVYTNEMAIDVPKEILGCRVVSRELKFSSDSEIEDFKLEQRVILHGQMIERWRFDFGFVIPQSFNSWQQIIEAAAPDQMIPPEVLSGNVIFETCFFDGDILLASNKVRINYV